MSSFKPKFAVPQRVVPSKSVEIRNVGESINVPSKSVEIRNVGESITLTSTAGKESEDSVVSSQIKAFNNLDVDMANSVRRTCDVEMQNACGDPTEQPLREHEYDEIFDSVLKKAAAGVLFNTDELNAEVEQSSSPTLAAHQFASRTQNVSPTNVKVTNEITPNTSPIDENASPMKLLMQRPVKKKPEKGKALKNKRKTLEYLPSHDKTESSSHKNKEKKKKEIRRKSDSDVVTHRRKVLNKGLWVQCDNETCLKWRYLHNCSDPSTLPDYWTCSMNRNDVTQNKCCDPEIDWSSCLEDTGDHFVYTDYNAGSIVWARMPGYPSWPAMVDSDPDTNLFYDYDSQGRVLRYHVVFLDDQVSRAWIPTRSAEPYTSNSSHKLMSQYKSRDFKRELESAIIAADEAVQLSLEQRLEKYNFEKRFIAIGKRKDWAPKRAGIREKQRSATTDQVHVDDEQQVVPRGGDSKAGCSPKHDDDVKMKKKNRPVAKISHKSASTKPSASLNNKKTKPSKSHDEKLSKKKSENVSVEKKAIASIKPSFKAPRAKPAPQDVTKSPPAAVVPCLHPDSPEENVNTTESLPENKPLHFDSDIYTMELNTDHDKFLTPKKQQAEQPAMHTEDTNDIVELANVEQVVDLNAISPIADKDDFGKDFWETSNDKKVESGNPFDDLIVEEMDSEMWDEEKMQQLDELMPVITEHF